MVHQGGVHALGDGRADGRAGRRFGGRCQPLPFLLSPPLPPLPPTSFETFITEQVYLGGWVGVHTWGWWEHRKQETSG